MLARMTDNLRKLAVDVLIAALALLFCWLLARWTWVFVAPAAPAVPMTKTAVADSVDPVLAAHLFGAQGKDSSTRGAEPATSLNLKLRGVFAAGGRLGVTAVINAGARDDAFRVGDAVLPNVMLEAVFPDHVLLRRQGTLERLDLEEKAKVADLIAAAPERPRGADRP